jgi:hypothetical protein
MSRSSFRPALEVLEDRSLPSNIIWTNRLGPSDKFTPRERAVIDHAIVLWERVIKDFNGAAASEADSNAFKVRITGGTLSGLDLGGSIAGLGGHGIRGGSLQIDANGGGFGWFIDLTPADRSEYPVSHTPYHFSGGPAGNDLLSVTLHELCHALGFLGHFNDPNDLMNAFGTIGHRYLPSFTDAKFFADGFGYTVRTPGIAPRVGFPVIEAFGDESQPAPVINVIFSTVPKKTVKVNYKVIGGTATAGSDFVLANGTLTFAPKESKKSLPLSILADADQFGGFETIVIKLSSPVGATFLPGRRTHTFTIFDNV